MLRVGVTGHEGRVAVLPTVYGFHKKKLGLVKRLLQNSSLHDFFVDIYCGDKALTLVKPDYFFGLCGSPTFSVATFKAHTEWYATQITPVPMSVKMFMKFYYPVRNWGIVVNSFWWPSLNKYQQETVEATRSTKSKLRDFVFSTPCGRFAKQMGWHFAKEFDFVKVVIDDMTTALTKRVSSKRTRNSGRIIPSVPDDFVALQHGDKPSDIAPPFTPETVIFPDSLGEGEECAELSVVETHKNPQRKTRFVPRRRASQKKR